jgi:hypothetical protein
VVDDDLVLEEVCAREEPAGGDGVCAGECYRVEGDAVDEVIVCLVLEVRAAVRELAALCLCEHTSRVSIFWLLWNEI